MFRAIALPALVVMAALAGCFGDAGEEQGKPTTPSPSPGAQNTTVEILHVTPQAQAGQPINVTWQIRTPPRGNDTNESLEVTRTAVHYANHSVAAPNSTSDYGNASGERLSVALAPGRSNSTFNTTFSVLEEDTIYLRAHAEINGVDYWSNESAVRVDPAPEPKVWSVEIGSNSAGPLSDYDPDPVRIEVGDVVSWKNMDPLGATHTATSDAGAPKAFDTGSIAPRTNSTGILFTAAGTYNYHCSVHPTTMTGAQVIVA